MVLSSKLTKLGLGAVAALVLAGSFNTAAAQSHDELPGLPKWVQDQMRADQRQFKDMENALRTMPPGTFEHKSYRSSNGEASSMSFTNDRFTAKQKQNGISLIVKGKLSDGKATLEHVQVDDGKKSDKYTSLKTVPEKHRERVQKMLKSVEHDTDR